MKTKTLLSLSIFAIVPAMLSLLIVSIICFEWVVNGTNQFAEMFLNGKFNKPFTMILFGSGVFFLSLILATQLALIRYTSKIDNLDEAERQAWEAKRKYELATKKILQQIN